MVAAIEKDVVAAPADQPDDHGDVDFFALGSAHDEPRDFILSGSVAGWLGWNNSGKARAKTWTQHQ